MLTFRFLQSTTDPPILKRWFTDPETKRRMAGMLPLDRFIDFVRQAQNRICRMACMNGVPIGLVDAEKETNGRAYVGIIVDPDLRGRGYGRRMLHGLRALAELRDGSLHATVAPANQAAIRCLLQAGFARSSPEPDDEGFLEFSAPT
jgi:RimJ/RimL family protein N-acetyltransferase